MDEIENGNGHRRDIVVVGSSMGGVEALTRLAASLPSDLPAAVFIVQHVSSESPGFLADILSKAGPLQATMAVDGDLVRHGRLYVAPPDRHLLLRAGHVRVTKGPTENRARPAVDPLFRSAAVAYGTRVTGVILTGLLDDGAAGLRAIKRCGGLAIVQSPEDAAFPDMPLSALRAVEADHVLALADIPDTLASIVRTAAPPPVSPPEDLLLETNIAERAMGSIESMEHLGPPVPFTCRDCGGTLWEMNEAPLRYRCHLGHTFSARTLIDDTGADIEHTLWSALRLMEERHVMLERMVESERSSGRTRTAADYADRASEAAVHVDRLRRLLTAAHG